MPCDASTSALALTAIPENLLREPVEFLLADHFRVQEVCRSLVAIAAASDPGTMRNAAEAAQDFLTDALPLHMADEEEDLYPGLRDRCAARDGIALVLGVLLAEHERDKTLAAALVTDLREIAAGRAPADLSGFRHAVALFAGTAGQHIAFENGVLLPLARHRLTAADWIEMGRRMAARRGVDYPD